MTATNWDLWGRYETARPRRMLALDGGGIRGLLTLQVLKRTGGLVARLQHGDDASARARFRLRNLFTLSLEAYS
jgi:hypothetical protein